MGSRNADQTLTERLDLGALIAGLMGDLKALRAGKISNRDAHARAELARQVLRGVHYALTAQKFMEAHALPVPGRANDQSTSR